MYATVEANHLLTFIAQSNQVREKLEQKFPYTACSLYNQNYAQIFLHSKPVK